MAFSVAFRTLLCAAVALTALTTPTGIAAVSFKAEEATAADAAATVATATDAAAADAAASASSAAAATTANSTTTSASTSAVAGTPLVAPSAAGKHKGWLNPIVVKGNKFFDSKTGLEFRIKGMAYNPRPNAGELSIEGNYDWFVEKYQSVWEPHLDIMADLGVNTIRIYSVNPSESHDAFMCACASRGIYVLVGMAAPCKDCAIVDAKPPECYPDSLFTRMQMVYNAMAVYDNTLGFSVANENNMLVIKAGKDGTGTMPCAKALLRDVRNYAAYCQNSLRQVPIGIDLADTLPREGWMQYMDCAIDSNEFTRSQWIGFNPYVECDPATHTKYSQSTGLQNLMKVYDKVQYPRPLMFGEFGCILGKNTIDGYENQRGFYDAQWMNEEPEMTKQMVGGNVFEFVTEIPNLKTKTLSKAADPGKFGIGYFTPLTCDNDKVPCQFVPYPEYANLKKAYTSTAAPTLKMDAYTVDRTNVLTCPSSISTTLRDIPKVETLSCSALQPVCSGTKSNTDRSTGKAPALGTTTAPSNSDVSGTTTSPATTAVLTVAAAAVSTIAAVLLA